MKILPLPVLFVLLHVAVNAQPLPVGDFREEKLRGAQLAGRVDSLVSFTVRPIAGTSGYKRLDTLSTRPFFSFQLLPVSLKQRYTALQPFDWNDGSMIPASGYQAQLSAGLYTRVGALEIQLHPEFVAAGNKEFKGFPQSYPDWAWYEYHARYLNSVDAPERFGNKTYYSLFPGQSFMKLRAGPVSVGISTENLWWGPARRNSLLMSNTAPGMLHLTIHTNKPVKTPIGSFEGQLLSARLDASGYPPVTVKRGYTSVKPDDWRYLSGAVLTWQPRWVKGLFLGFDRVFMNYSENLGSSLSAYIPLLSPFEKNKTGAGNAEDALAREQLGSIFGRWLWQEEAFEFYFEYGRNDHAINTRDLEIEPEHSNAYTVGISKVFPVRSKRWRSLAINAEVTRLSAPGTSMVRELPSWYKHYQVVDGYTQRGQWLGAGIGSGSDGVTFSADLSHERESVRIRFEVVNPNLDIYRSIFRYSGSDSKWSDRALSVAGYKKFNRLGVSADIKFISSQNYQWQPGVNVFNFVLNTGLTFNITK